MFCGILAVWFSLLGRTIAFVRGGGGILSMPLKTDGNVCTGYIPANTGCSTNVVVMLGQRPRRWAIIKSALVKRVVFAGCAASCQKTRDIEPMLGQCWPSVYDAGPTLTRHWLDVSCLLGGEQPRATQQSTVHRHVHQLPVPRQTSVYVNT